MSASKNAAAIAEFVIGLQSKPLPDEVVAIAKQSLIDWFAVCIAATLDPEATTAARVVHGWRSQGDAIAVDGLPGAAGPVALVNGTYSHALDYDDFHIGSVHHAGGPTFAAALALAMDRGFSGDEVLKAFVAGFEVSTQIGMDGVGLTLGNAGWHPTCVLGHLSATVACALLLRLDGPQIEQALGFAAAQAGGLMSAAGSIAKPMIVGKSALAGVLSAELAEQRLRAPERLLEGAPGLFATLLQQDTAPNLRKLGIDWQVLNNTFKPYSACQLTHASIDAARTFAPPVTPESIRAVRAYVHPFAKKIACHDAPVSPLQARFSLKHCIAMTLLGYGAGPADFNESRVADPDIHRLRELIEIVPTEEVARTASRLEIVDLEGKTQVADIPAALGSLDRPMTTKDTAGKFLESTADVLDSRGKEMLELLKDFDRRGSIGGVAELLKSVAASRTGNAILVSARL